MKGGDERTLTSREELCFMELVKSQSVMFRIQGFWWYIWEEFFFLKCWCPLCSTKHHVMKTYGGIEVWLHTFLSWALHVSEWPASSSGRFTPSERESCAQRRLSLSQNPCRDPIYLTILLQLLWLYSGKRKMTLNSELCGRKQFRYDTVLGTPAGGDTCDLGAD